MTTDGVLEWSLRDLHFFHFHFIITVTLRHMKVGIIWSRSEFISAEPRNSITKARAKYILTHFRLQFVRFLSFSARIRLNSALIVGCLNSFFLATLSKVFWEGIIKPYEGPILTSGKVCCVQYLVIFRLISGYTCERLIPGLRRKDWILRALLLAVTSLWPHKVGSRGEIYSARWKLMLLSDQAKAVVKKCFESGGAPCLLFNPWFTSGILNKSTV